MSIITTASALSSAPATAFFARWGDVETWPEWNTDTAWVRLDGPFVQGATGVLKPKGGPKVPFTVAQLDEHAFVDVSRMPGGRITFDHRIEEGDGGTRIEVTVSIDGPLGWVWRRILASDFRAALQPDLDRLVATAEADRAQAA